ncbi:Methyl-accepting chemotaxis protein [Filomicrobium insigne]|uniref:Methyl-accepting chemotaxis protein n=1 Tax=Filomicrobium insigne TaxID=418854 RepID=A0A1H0T465_9HYPH|nr:methyl-accepting chemotaxis protein [Filomicrobium insigne]SDP48611.1 Methyl-accepting chemotaxis protein [Filomicrobium insigne]
MSKSENLAVSASSFDPRAVSFAGKRKQLAEPRDTIEQTFTEMGGRLIGCTSQLRQIADAHENMPAELQSAEFESAIEMLEAIREQLAELVVAHSAEQDDIVQLTSTAGRVKKPLTDLREAVRAIRFIAVNARVVAAGIKGAHGTFDASTTDMAELGRSVEGAVSAFSRSFEGLGAGLAVARSANAAFAVRHEATLNHVSGKLSEHLSILTQHRSRAADKAGDHAASLSRLTARVGEAVAALQIGDITRQRVEHIEEALGMLDDYSNDTEKSAIDPTLGSNTISVVLGIQAEQLDEAISDFDEQVAGLAQILGQLAEDTAAVLRENSEEAEQLFSKSGTALAALIDDLREICVLFDDFEKTHAGLQKITGEVAKSVGAMVAAMAEHVETIRDIELRIRMLSLNTVIQCSQLGDQGDALMVVAQNLRSLAEATVEAAESIMTELAEVDMLAQRLVERRSAAAADNASALGQGARDAIALFETAVGRMRACVETMSSAGPRTISLLDETIRSVSGRREFADTWPAVLREFQVIAPTNVQKTAASGFDQAFMGKLRARYTMDSERRLHDLLLGAAPDSQAVTAPLELETSLDDIFF